MNIFVLDRDPVKAAACACDKHVVRMVLETAQLLCSPFDAGTAPYKRTHYNHPSAIWARASRDNFTWLYHHGVALGEEYGRRYGRQHKSRQVIQWAFDHSDRLALPATGLTEFPQAMPTEYQSDDPVVAYRTYYRKAKARFATWRPPAQPPEWWQSAT